MKLDEADIGISGPEQIEDAIETLDAQTESRPSRWSAASAHRRRVLRRGSVPTHAQRLVPMTSSTRL